MQQISTTQKVSVRQKNVRAKIASERYSSYASVSPAGPAPKIKTSVCIRSPFASDEGSLRLFTLLLAQRHLCLLSVQHKRLWQAEETGFDPVKHPGRENVGQQG